MQTWIAMLPQNFSIYCKAYLQETYGFWSLDNSYHPSGYKTIYVTAFEDWIEEEQIGIKCILPEELQERAEKFLQTATRFLGAGVSFWIFTILLLTAAFKYGWKILLVGTPIIGNWLTIMIATPEAWCWRYVYCIPMALPFMVGIIFLSDKNDKLAKETEPAS